MDHGNKNKQCWIKWFSFTYFYSIAFCQCFLQSLSDVFRPILFHAKCHFQVRNLFWENPFLFFQCTLFTTMFLFQCIHFNSQFALLCLNVFPWSRALLSSTLSRFISLMLSSFNCLSICIPFVMKSVALPDSISIGLVADYRLIIKDKSKNSVSSGRSNLKSFPVFFQNKGRKNKFSEKWET